MKRKLSSFDIYIVVKELQQKIVGCQIEKIYQISRNEILIRIKNIETKEKKQLYIRNGELICLTDKDFQKPTKPSSFAMALRKYLQNGRILEVFQHEFDRILKIRIGKKDGAYGLVIEFFSDGNIILVDPNQKIILPFIRQAWAHRKVKGREQYTPPPSQINPFELTLKQLKEILFESNADLVRTLAVNVNLSGVIAEEICTLADVDKNIKTKDLDDEKISKVFTTLKDFLNIFKQGDFKSVFVKKEEEIVDVLPFVFKSYSGFSFEKIDSLLKSFEIFIKPVKQEDVKKTESKIDKKLGKLQRQNKQQEETIKKFEKQIEQKKIEGDLIYLHYQEIEKILTEISQVLELKEKKEGIKEINKLDLVKNFEPVNNLLTVKLSDTSEKKFDVKLNFRKTVSENAEKAYDDNKKIRNKLKGALKALERSKEQIISVEKQKTVETKKQIEEAEKKCVKEKTFWFERHHWFISNDGNIVIGGKDAKSNDVIVKKYLKEGDRYAHADIQGASSIIIKRKGMNDKIVDISNDTLEDACIFAACFSKAWKQFAEAQAYWVLPEQVSKTPQSGEFVPKGAFIIRGKRNYYRVKLELAVGLIKIEDNIKVMCGPVTAVKKHAEKYVIITPGATKKNDVAHKIGKVFEISVDSVDRVLPPGGCSIVEAVGVVL